MKIGLFLDNTKISHVDLSKPENGNPGIGGTEYMFLSMPYYFKKFIFDDTEFIYYVPKKSKIHKQFTVLTCHDCYDAYLKAIQNNCDIFIWRPIENEENLYFLNKIVNFSLPVIAWVHNTLSEKMLNLLAEETNIKRYTTVSEEQLDILRHHQILNKSCTIYNGFDLNTVEIKSITEKDPNMVVYIGSMIKSKGFGILAKSWKKILLKHPTAQLYVIGSGKLYNRNQKLGRWNVADEEFESREIRPYLSDDDGQTLPSVHFLGLLGKEKNEYLSKAQVGVVNPSALTENCPGSALEFQASNTPVVSRADWGLLDTVLHTKTGLLGDTDEDLVNNILFFLQNPNDAYDYGKEGRKFISEKFSYSKIVLQWQTLFYNIIQHKPTPVLPIKKNIFFRRKWLRELIRICRRELFASKIEKPFDEENDINKLVFIHQTLSYYIQTLSDEHQIHFRDTINDYQKKEHTINELTEKLQKKEHTINELTEKLQKKEHTINELTEKLQKKEHTINELTEKLQKKEHTINELTEKLQKKENQLRIILNSKKYKIALFLVYPYTIIKKIFQ